MRQGVKWAVGLLCAIGVLACGGYPWPVGSAIVGAEIDRAIPPPFGLHWRGPASATLALLPWPTLRVRGVELVDAGDRNVLSAPVAQVSLSLKGLLGGRLVPIGATLSGPTAFIDLDASPVAAAAAQVLSAVENGEPSALWSHVRVRRGGALHIVSATHRFDALIERLDGSLDWPSVDKPIGFAIAGAWRNEVVRIEGKIDEPRQGLRKSPTGVRLAIASRPLALVLNGTWGGDGAAGFAGDLTAHVDSLIALERLFDVGPAPLIVGDALSVSGKAQTNGASLALSDAELDLAGQKFEGALALSGEEARTTLSGTLAADSLSIEPLLGPPPTFMNDQGDWSDKPFGFAPPRAFDLDLRISAAHAEWRGLRLDDLAGSLICRDGQLAAKLLEASAYQGALKGQLTLTSGPDGLQAQMAGSLADADLGAALADFGWNGYRGLGGFDFSLRSTGFAPADSVASLAGTALLDLQAGVVDGVNVEEAMRRSQRRPVDLARDMAIGQTTFAHGRAKFAVADGDAEITEAQIEGPGSAIEVEGAIDVAARAVHARLAAIQADAEGAPSANGAWLTIVVDGPWSAPSVAASPNGG